MVTAPRCRHRSVELPHSRLPIGLRSRYKGGKGVQEKIDDELHLVGLEHFSEVIAQRMDASGGACRTLQQ